MEHREGIEPPSISFAARDITILTPVHESSNKFVQFDGGFMEKMITVSSRSVGMFLVVMGGIEPPSDTL